MTAKNPLANYKAPDGEPFKFAAYATMFMEPECLEWPFATASGYATMYLEGRKVGVHRLVTAAWQGQPKLGEEALHSCDNRACVNPLHLRWGTRQDNVDDMMARKRHWRLTWTRS